MKKKLSFVLLSGLTFFLSFLIHAEQAQAMQSNDTDNTVRLHNTSPHSQTIQIWTKMTKCANGSKSNAIKYKEKHTLRPDQAIELRFSPGEAILFRIRTYTQDYQFPVDYFENHHSYVSVTNHILPNAEKRIWCPGETVVPYLWQQEEHAKQQPHKDDQAV